MLNNISRKIIKDYVIKNYNKINIKSGVCRYNYKCHLNSVHDALNDDDEKIAMCVYIDDDYPIIHFVNYNGTDFIDNTLGRWSEHYYYYFIEWVYRDDFFKVDLLFDNKRNYFGKLLPFYIRWFSNYRG